MSWLTIRTEILSSGNVIITSHVFFGELINSSSRVPKIANHPPFSESTTSARLHWLFCTTTLTHCTSISHLNPSVAEMQTLRFTVSETLTSDVFNWSLSETQCTVLDTFSEAFAPRETWQKLDHLHTSICRVDRDSENSERCQVLMYGTSISYRTDKNDV